MVSSIVDENSEYQDHEMFQPLFPHQAAWINGEQIDPRMHYAQQMKV